LLAVPPVDFVLHNSTFLVAHFHNVIIGGVVFGAMAGYNYWFPKAFGFTLDERLGKASFWCWLIGFYLAFMPLYVLGMMGMTRRLQHHFRPELAAAAASRGAWRRPHLLRHPLPDRAALCQHPHSRKPPRPDRRPVERPNLGVGDLVAAPAYNFAVMPKVETIDAFWEIKRRGLAAVEPTYETIEMPRNSPTGFVTAFFAVVTGFALIWHIWWMVILGLLAAAVTVLVFGWSENRESEIPANEIARLERARLGLGRTA